MTKLYLRDSAAPSGMPSDAQSGTGLPFGTLRTAAGWTTQRGMDTTAGASQVTDSETHDATTSHYDWKYRIFGWALPTTSNIAAQNWTFALVGGESNAAANTCFEVALYVYRSGTGVVGHIANPGDVTIDSSALYDEFGTTKQGRVETLAGSAVSGIQSGDVLVLEVWEHVQQSMTTAYTSEFAFNGTTDPVDNTANTNAASYIESTDDLTGGGGPQTVSAGLIDQSSVLFSPTITSKATVSPGLIDQSAALFAPTITSKSTITPGLIDQSGTLLAPSISILGGAQTVSPGLISQTGALFNPTITSKSTINPSLVDQSGVLFSPTITSKSTVVPGLIDQSATLFAPSVSISGGPQTVSPGLIDRSGVLFSPTVLSSQTVSPGLISQVPILFNPMITSKLTLTIPLISQAGTLFSPAIQQDQVVSPLLISNLAIVFTLIVVSGALGEPVNDPQAVDLVSAGQASVFGLEEGRAVDISHQ